MVAAGGGHVAGAAVGGGPSSAVWRRAVVMKVSGENGGKNIHLAKNGSMVGCQLPIHSQP